MTCIARINKKLKELGYEQRLTRNPAGYYYVTGVAVSSGLYVYKLEDEDYPMAWEHVMSVLKDDGVWK